MNKWVFFGGGFVAGIVITILSLYFYSTRIQGANDGTTWFEKPGEVVEVRGFEVFQVLAENAALVHGERTDSIAKSFADMGRIFSGKIFLLTNSEGKYYYDEEIIDVPEGKVARQVGIYKYKTREDFEKTVPIIQIMDK